MVFYRSVMGNLQPPFLSTQESKLGENDHLFTYFVFEEASDIKMTGRLVLKVGSKVRLLDTDLGKGQRMRGGGPTNSIGEPQSVQNNTPNVSFLGETSKRILTHFAAHFRLDVLVPLHADLSSSLQQTKKVTCPYTGAQVAP